MKYQFLLPLFLIGCSPMLPPTQSAQPSVIVSPPNCYCIMPGKNQCESPAQDARTEKKNRTDRIGKLKEEVTKAKEQVEQMKGTATPPDDDRDGASP